MFVSRAVIVSMLLSVIVSTGLAQDSLYSRAYGNAQNPAIIFLHGGPGYNAVSFEATTADSLAGRGYYVVTFDQRGSGRSEHFKGKYTYAEAIEDIRSIYERYHLTKATLLGHSWGGALAILFASAHPALVRAVVLVSAPLSMQRTLHTIMKNYAIKFPDTASTEHQMWGMTNDLDPKTFPYSSGAFQLAMSGGFYQPRISTEKAKSLKARLRASDTSLWSSHMSFPPTLGLFKNEHYTQLDVTDTLAKLATHIPVFGIYGSEDGLFDDSERQIIRHVTSEQHFFYVMHASHNIFIDQQDAFLDAVVTIMRDKK